MQKLFNHLWDTPDFWVSLSKRFRPFLSIPTQQLSNSHSAFLNSYQHAENQLISSISEYTYILTTTIQKQVTTKMARPPQNIWMFYITIEHKSSYNTFFLIYCWNITNFLFRILWACLTASIKSNNANF